MAPPRTKKPAPRTASSTKRPAPAAKKPAPKAPSKSAKSAEPALPEVVSGPAMLVAPEAESRRSEVLVAALHLFAEKGFEGASLRELARRLHIAQPSLYHYATNKEDLLRQVIEYVGGTVLYGYIPHPLPQTLEALPGFMRDIVENLYDQPLYPVFLRLLMANSPAQPVAEAAARMLYSDTFELGVKAMFGNIIERGELTEVEAKHFARMVVCALGLPLMEYRVFYGEKETNADLRAYGSFVVEFALRGLRAWKPNALGMSLRRLP